MVLNCVKMLNYFPPKGGVSDAISPKTIMSGKQLDYKKHLTLKIGQYCQVHEEENPRNSQVWAPAATYRADTSSWLWTPAEK